MTYHYWRGQPPSSFAFRYGRAALCWFTAPAARVSRLLLRLAATALAALGRRQLRYRYSRMELAVDAV